MTTTEEAERILDDYWARHYIGPRGLCTLCGNTGIIDTMSAYSAAGVFAGRYSEYCICPNGRQMREVSDGLERVARELVATFQPSALDWRMVEVGGVDMEIHLDPGEGPDEMSITLGAIRLRSPERTLEEGGET